MFEKIKPAVLLSFLIVSLQLSVQVDTLALDSSSIEFKIKRELERLDDWAYYSEPEVDIDSLGWDVIGELVNYLKIKPFPIDSNIVNLWRLSTPDSLISIYGYAYSSGGTAGEIYTAIIQWKKSDGSYGAEELVYSASFYEAFTLAKTSDHVNYLFIGGFRGSGRLECAVAFVVELSGDELNLNYKAFYSSNSALLYFDDIYSGENYCIACIDYSETKKEISIKELGPDDRVGTPNEFASEVEDHLKGRTKIRYVFDGEQFIEK